MSDRLVLLARFRYRHQADTARGFLKDAGIPAVVSADDAGGNLGFTICGNARLLVRPNDLKEATELLAECGILERKLRE